MTSTPPGQDPQTSTPSTPAGGSSSSPTLDSFLAGAKKAAEQARATVAKVTHDNRAKIDSALTKAGTAIDQRTSGKYSKQIESVKSGLGKVVDVVEGSAAGTTSAPVPGAAASSPSTVPPTAPATPTPPAATTPATPPAEGWHRAPDGSWVKTEHGQTP